ncbi:MAG: nucleotide exchange factor GrpE [Alphaproteobacteria bacterium GWF2_58_20]|nr:MAG: nucleotide exchange factor GrpE [Alphaproteobacteria bacterium GWF2_58_20]
MTKSHHHHTDTDAKAEIRTEMEQDQPPAAENPCCEHEAEIATLKDKLLRAVADHDNLQKRANRDREDIARFAVSGFAKDLLNVADNLRRALEAAPEDQRTQNEALANLVAGVEATEREMMAAFTRVGIVQIAPTDGVFDPHQHEVMFDVDMPDKDPGTIIQLIAPGYLIHGRLLRPARVGVVRNPAAKGGNIDQSA